MAFDVQAYLDANPDVAAVAANGNWTDDQVIEHYVNYGFEEGRPVVWDADLYLELNPDVALVYGADNALAHYFVFGIAENRAYYFDAEDYLAANPDLVAAGITTETGALSHYQNYGRFEDRLLGFDAEAYLEMYDDLVAAGITEETALEHYLAFGQAEGRAYDPVIEDAAPLTENEITATETALGYTLSLDTEGQTMGLTADNLEVDPGDGLDILRLVGDADIRIDMTNPASQVEGIDLNANGMIDANGIENNVAGNDILTVSNFTVVDAYRRDFWDRTATSNEDNFRGDILFDGTGWEGDGVNTDGNIFLGGIGDDTAYGGIGNDFLAGGTGADDLSGGRNADFFFVEVSDLDLVDGDNLDIDGGITYDNSSAQDFDWILLEASDDDEPVYVNLASGTIMTDTTFSDVYVDIDNIENVDASGNLYGFLNNIDTILGGRYEYDQANTPGEENYGLGSTAQMIITGTNGNNIIVGGYDNDIIYGDSFYWDSDNEVTVWGNGNDILLGGNMMYLTENQNNPNILNIPNDGRDELYGGSGNDQILFELDGGVYDGGGDIDTLWMTDYVGGTADSLPSSLFLDLGKTQGQEYDGYGTQATGSISNFENVITTGLGALDYDTDGTNNSELNFTEQMNFDAIGDVDLDLRGSTGMNTMYASAGDDVLEGRNGNDYLSGGEGNDDFYFSLDGDDGEDDLNVIHRQVDADGDGIWDGSYGQDFGLDSSTVVGSSVLQIAITSADNPGAELGEIINRVSEIRTGVLVDGAFDPIVLNTDAIKAADTYQGLTDAINAALDETDYADDLTAELQADGVTIYISDVQGRQLADDPADADAGVDISQMANTQTENIFLYGEPEEIVSEDRLIFKSYEDRADNEGVDDDAVTGSEISLGSDAYAQDLVASFGESTVLAEDQGFDIEFDNLTTEDVVTITVNGVEYSLQVGIDLDGTHIENEDAIDGWDQDEIQENFLARLESHINSFMDDDTAAGQVFANYLNDGETIRLTQVGYGEGEEETVFMEDPVVTIENKSGGEIATADVDNLTETEVTLYQFDGTDNALNEENVLFIGEEFVNRSVFATALDAGGELMGSDAIVIDGGVDDDLAEIDHNLATDTNTTLDDNFAVHGDDLLFGGIGDDEIYGLTGDDRIVGSAGDDIVDGGKDYYSVLMVGDDEATVEYLNAYEARMLDADGDVLEINLILQTETNEEMIDGPDPEDGYVEYFDDTLMFQQGDFITGATEFTIELDNYSGTGANIVFDEGGAGHVYVDEDGDGDFEDTTAFTNFENIRTLSGTGLAVADAGQGNDTLDLTDLSVDSSGVTYYLVDGEENESGDVFANTGHLFDGVNNDTDGNDLTSEAPGSYPLGDDALAGYLDYTPPEIGVDIYFGKVDGVENVLASLGDDLLFIDESEAAKDNLFSAGLGDDAIVYQNDYDLDAGDPASRAVEPQVTITVNASADTDIVTMTAGRVGQTVAEDTLIGVEHINLEENTAQGVLEDDTIDVSAMTTGAVVDYVLQEVRDLAGNVELTIAGMAEMEHVIADGDDTVIVDDSSGMSDANATSDDDSEDIVLDTYLNYDILDNLVRQSIADLRASGEDIPQVRNYEQYTFELGTDTDRVDYSNAEDQISALVTVEDDDVNYVMVNGGVDPDEYDGESDRIDRLESVEEIVASQGESILDFTALGQDTEITFQFDEDNAIPALDRMETMIRIADGDGNEIDGLANYIEYYDLNDDDDIDAFTNATFNRIEGSDYGETVYYDGSEDLINLVGLDHRYTNDELNLRGGDNGVSYYALETSITAVVNVTEFDAADKFNTGLIEVTVDFQDGSGNALAGAGQHEITSYTGDNGIAAGTLKLEASQDAEDEVTFGSVSEKVFILGQSAGVLDVMIGDLDAMTLTGFERLLDAESDDVYDMTNLTTVIGGLELIDNEVNDIDTIKVYNDAIGFQAAPANTIDLGVLNLEFGFDFDILDVTGVTDDELVLVGDDGSMGYNSVTEVDPPGDTSTASLLGDGALAVDISPAGDRDWYQVFLQEGQTYTFTLTSLGGSVNPELILMDTDGVGTAATGSATNPDVIVYTAEETGTYYVNAGEDGDDDTLTGSLTVTTRDIAGAGDEESVVVGSLDLIGDDPDVVNDIQLFDTIIFTDASITSAGDTFTVDMDNGEFLDAGSNELFDFDAALNIFDFSRVTSGGVEVDTDSAATAVTLRGTAADDILTGGGGNDTFAGGLGADVMDGDFVPAQGATYSVTISGVAAESGTELGGGTLTIAGMTLNTAAAPAAATDIAENADADQIGAAFAAQTLADWQAALETDGLNAAEAGALTSVTYDATSNELLFTFDTTADTLVGAGNLIGSTTAPAAGGDADLTHTEDETDFVAQADSADTFLYALAAESTAASMDSIANFTINNVVDDVLDFTDINAAMGGVLLGGINNGGDAVDFDTVTPTFNAGDSVYVASDGDDARVYVDADNSGDFGAGDMVIELAGITTVADFDADNVAF